MAKDEMFLEAVEAIRRGERARGRELLTRLLRTNKENPSYWLWMSAVVDTSTERVYCLEMALRFDPQNAAARRGLVLLGGLPAGEDVKPVPPQRQKPARPPQDEGSSRLSKGVLARPALSASIFAFLGLLVASFIFFNVLGGRPGRRQAYAPPTYTPKPLGTFTPTPTLLTTNTPVVRSPTPTFQGPTPLWMFLDATYTATPVYINTPHPLSEAYVAGMRALARQNWSLMLNFMLQASEIEPGSADALYYAGEAHRMLGDFRMALETYEKALSINPAFAPSYLGLARVQMRLDPRYDPAGDLQRAIELDPNLAEAYLERAAFWIDLQQPESALADIQLVEGILPDSPLVYLLRAQAYLQLNEPEIALENALFANALDFTLLPAYRTLGQSLLLNDKLEAAGQALQTYLIYEHDDTGAWLALGQVVFAGGQDYPAAIEHFNRALALDDTLVAAYNLRGLSYLELDLAQQAVNDFTVAIRLDPGSYPICVNLGRALLTAGRAGEAYQQLSGCPDLAQESDSLASLYHWRALSLDELGNPRAAGADWQALVGLEIAEDIPDEWIAVASKRLLELFPPSATPTKTATLRPSPSLTATTTLTPSPPPVKSPTPGPDHRHAYARQDACYSHSHSIRLCL